MWAGSYNTVALAKSGEVIFQNLITVHIFSDISPWNYQVLVCGLNNYNQLGVAEVMGQCNAGTQG